MRRWLSIRGNVYMTLYKFASAEIGQRILLDRLIRFTQPPALNDPFDSKPLVSDFFSGDQLRPFIEGMSSSEGVVQYASDKVLSDYYEQLPPLLRAQFIVAQWVEYARPLAFAALQRLLDDKGLTLPELITKKMSENTELHRLKTEQMLQESISKYLGVLSLSAECNHNLLWAHYADSHKGIAIGFNQSHPFFTDVKEVEYVTSRPSLSIREAVGIEDKAKKAAISTVFSKNIDWSYEHEYRMVRPLANAQKSDQIDCFGFTIYLFRFPESCVHEVILGARISPERVVSIKNILSDDLYKHIKLFRAQCEPEGFSIQISPESK
jgi:hypothetical protein